MVMMPIFLGGPLHIHNYRNYHNYHALPHLDDFELDELGGESNELVRVDVRLLCPLVPTQKGVSISALIRDALH